MTVDQSHAVSLDSLQHYCLTEETWWLLQLFPSVKWINPPCTTCTIKRTLFWTICCCCKDMRGRPLEALCWELISFGSNNVKCILKRHCHCSCTGNTRPGEQIKRFGITHLIPCFEGSLGCWYRLIMHQFRGVLTHLWRKYDIDTWHYYWGPRGSWLIKKLPNAWSMYM